MIRNITVGIDVGSAKTRVVVGEFQRGNTAGEKTPKIIGGGESETSGMRHGYVADSGAVAASIKSAVAMAEKSSGIKIKRALLSLSGTTLRGEVSSGLSVISKADGEVTTLDVNKALSDCEENLNLGNKKVIQVFPLSFRLDGKEVEGRLEGMRGTKLEAKALFITYSVQHLEDLLEAVALSGVETTDVIASPIALSHLVLSPKQKMVGVALVNIGAETTSLAVFENGTLLSLQTFGIGSSNITNDIALGFKVPLEKAENFKFGNIEENISEKKLSEIIEARLSDIFESIENHLKKIKRNELLPAGVIFAGGGAYTFGLLELSKSLLKLPSAIATTEIFGNSKTKLRDLSWYTALGLISSGKEDERYSDGSFANLYKDLKSAIKSSLKQLMP